MALECSWEAPLADRGFNFPVKAIKDLGIGGDGWRLWRSILEYLMHLPRLFYQLYQIARQNRVAAFDVQFVTLNALHLVLAKRLGLFRAQVVLTFQGSDIRHALQTSGLERALFRWMLRNADTVVACSQGLMDEVLSLEPCLRNSLVIHNAIHVGRLSQVGAPVAAREPGTELLVNIGRFEHRKGHDLIVRAFAEIAGVRPNARLWIIGMDGPTYQETADLVRELGLSTKVRLFRDIPHEQIASLVLQADIFVFASRWIKGVMGEGLPLAVLEAGLLGLPVVSTRTCGIDELLVDGRNARVVDLESAPQLVAAITALLENPAEARRLAANLRQLVSTKYSVQRAWQLYRSLIP